MALLNISGDQRGGADAPKDLPSLLRAMIDTARDAIWCIEYVEPVDLSAPETDIVRQVFENRSRWAVCNRAMARLYGLPSGVDFNERAVSAYFPREPANEALVRALIANDFDLDDAPAIDRRHDGSVMHVENDMRGQIEDGRLIRMWGTVRDVSARRATELRLSDQVGSLRDVLGALPDPVLVIDGAGAIVAMNPAAEMAFGQPADAALGSSVADLFDGFDVGALTASLGGVSLLPGRTGPAIAQTVASGGTTFLLHVALAPNGAHGPRYVITARQAS